VIGSGPAGLAAAQQLCRAGHWVSVFEKSDRLGGLLRYGIPNFKMEKDLIDRRVAQLSAEGVEFLTGKHVGVDVAVEDLKRDFDAILISTGAEAPRKMNVPGAHLKGIEYAMDYLTQQNRVCEGDTVPSQILATGKRVAIIGGGDTGSGLFGYGAQAEGRFDSSVGIQGIATGGTASFHAVADVAAPTARREFARRRRISRVVGDDARFFGG
jgi:glutamate synthase (NADPH/NADH) small chain